MTWRYLAQRIVGPAAGSFIDTELPIAGVSLTDVLSGPPRMTGTVPVELDRLRGPDGKPLLDPWSTAIWAEEDGVIRGGGILVSTDFFGPQMRLDIMGYTGYPAGLAYVDSWFGVQIDPLDVVRHIWAHIQGKPNGNLGLVVDATKTPKRIGQKLETATAPLPTSALEYEAGPYRLTWYLTPDLGSNIDKLAEETPFDYTEEHGWAGDGTITHRLRLHYPRKGTRRTDLRFMLGENMQVIPELSLEGDDYANGVLQLGAGEGRNMVRATVENPDGRLRRIVQRANKADKTVRTATVTAKSELRVLQRLGDVTSIEVRDHPNAPLGAWNVGDEIRVQGDTGWVVIDQWVRIIESSLSPDSGDAAKLSVEKSDTQ